ncbi:TetR/AcrR family transcriptional regulator [Zhihengliuella flava]|uniref:AcrR family transcriptional regulator n=1 Tax=Zhihengliuella flava TaxID=1285193 RepID=A0A931D4Y4_9MICC|nr:AcrR family transcriptional regulator [Zhihengliuella flava]
MQSNESEPTRRELNRRQTERAIHDAAHGMAAEHGPAAVTVEAVAEAAGISRRTFFNYFASKEDAILGMRVPEVTEEAIAHFRTSTEDLLTRTVRLLATSLAASAISGTFARRRAIIQAHPALRERMIQHVSGVERSVADELVRVDGAASADHSVAAVGRHDDEGPPVTETSRALLLLAGAITRFAIASFQDSASDVNDVQELEAHLQHAMTLFRGLAATEPELRV